MDRSLRIVRLIALAAVALALYPLGRLASDYLMVQRYLAEFPELEAEPREADGFDWIAWNEREGYIEAAWVFPSSPAALAGIEPGDRFYMLEFEQYFDVEDLQEAIRGTAPGGEHTYLVERNGQHVQIPVRIGRYPTFLYPRSSGLWLFALWGFAIGAFVHLIALLVGAPLARSRPEARYEFLLVVLSAIWVVGNLLRLGLLTLFGPPEAGSLFDDALRTLTLLGMVGWLGFPLLLLEAVLRDAVGTGPRRLRVLLFVPPTLLAAAVAVITLIGPVGPLTLEGLLVPILFYVACYIAAAAAIVQWAVRRGSERAAAVFGQWGPVGSAVALVLAVVAALSVQEIVPLASSLSDITAGWIVVSAQLLAVVPVTLFSYGTLRHGRVEDVLSRALVYLVVLGTIFFAFVAGMSLLEPVVASRPTSRNVVGGLFVIMLLLVADRLGRRLREVSRTVFGSERQRGRQQLARFQERMREIVDLETLCREAVDRVSEALGVRTAVLYLASPAHLGSWVSSKHHPEPPYLTDQTFHAVWPAFEDHPRIWSRDAELDDRNLPHDLHAMLAIVGAALAVPIRGDGGAVGLLVLGAKRTGGVYNLDDVDLLRSIGGQLALAVDRLALVEREKKLAREASEAQLLALRSQINPHFLFNALNTIIAHIDERPDDAESTVEHLASIFRYTLQASGAAFVPLADELALIEHYLAVERSRFGAKLQVEIDVDPRVAGIPVPAFVVQTLAENAVKHGIERKRDGGRLCISARPDGPDTIVTVTDTGVGIPALQGDGAGDPAARDAFFGIGLQNVRDRLRLHYGLDDLIRLSSASGQGTTAVLRIPGTNRIDHVPDRVSHHPPTVS